MKNCMLFLKTGLTLLGLFIANVSLANLVEQQDINIVINDKFTKMNVLVTAKLSPKLESTPLKFVLNESASTL
jgi:hypothetical protein